jgi:ribosomal protein S15
MRPAVKPTAAPLPLVTIANASSKAQARRHRDPYALAQAKQRKNANLRRQEELANERQSALGDPVRGSGDTLFLKSFDIGAPLQATDAPSSGMNIAQSSPLNHFLKHDELETALQHSYILTQPILSINRNLADPTQEAEDIAKHAEDHERAVAAVSRIVSLSNGNQKDRTRFNVQRCIDTFGRHNTDSLLVPRALSQSNRSPDKAPPAEKTPRAGPDTGSSEVQIAILTAKIRVLVKHLEVKGAQKDKINKRNLRVLVHKRQKLLAYLRRKERGSERWEHVVSTLGLTDGTWKGEISL